MAHVGVNTHNPQLNAPLPALPPKEASPSPSPSGSRRQQGPAAAASSSSLSSSSSSSSSSGSSRLQAYCSLLSASNLLPGHTIADLYSLRHLSIQGGVPDKPSWLRPQAWRVLLGYLPPEKREWPQTLSSRRHEYAQFLVDFLQPLASADPAAAHPGEGTPQSGLPGRANERDQLLDQLYKDIIRSRKNGFAFYHADVQFSSDTQTGSADATRAQALDLRQSPLHRIRFLNHDYAAVTSIELGEMPHSTANGMGPYSGSGMNTPTTAAPVPLPATSDAPVSSMPPPPTILLPVSDSAPLPAPAPPAQPTFESLFDPAQHSSTPAGDAPAPFAADAVALPPPSAVTAENSELDDLTKILDEEPESTSAAGALQLDTSSRSRSSSSDSQMTTGPGQPPELTLSSPPPANPSSEAPGSSATFASVVENVRDVYNNLTGQEATETEDAMATAEMLDRAAEDMPTPQQAMLEARKAHQEEIQEAQEEGADSEIAATAHAVSPALTATVQGSGRSDGTNSASRTPLASAMALPPAHAVEGFAPSLQTAATTAPPLIVAPVPTTAGAEGKWLRDRRWHAILRILYVYALLNPSVGYIQGLNEVAFVIYWVMSQAPRSGQPVASPTTPRQQPLSPDYMDHSAGATAFGGLSPSTPSSAESRVQDLGGSEDQADELDLEADAFWCFSLLVGSVRELYEFDGIDHAAAGLRVRNARNAGGDGLSGAGNAFGWSRAESGMAGALRRLSLRLKWVDEPLWAELRRASLDPRLPYYSFRWLACLLSNELALPSVVRLWDALLAEQDSSSGAGSASSTQAVGASTGLAASSRVEFLIDICAALLVRLREPLMRPPPRSTRKARARRQRTIRRRTPSNRADDTDSDAPSLDEDEEEEEADTYDEDGFAQDDFAYKMHILQTFPDNLDLDVDVGPLLEQAYIFRQRRLAADLTGDGPPTADEDDADELRGSTAAPTLQALGQRASSAWTSWRTRPAAQAANSETNAGQELGIGTPSVKSPGSWFSSIGTRFASMPTPSSTPVADREAASAQPSPAPRRLGGSFQKYAEALQSSDAAANLAKASTNLTAKAMVMSASWNQRGQQHGGDTATPGSPWNESFAASGRASTLGAAPSSLFAKARSVSASYMATMTNGDARRPSTGDESDSSLSQHPTRWSRVPIPNFPLPDPNDSDGRGKDHRSGSYLGARSGDHMRPQSPEGSEAGSESSSGRRMLPSLRMAAKLGLLPQDRAEGSIGRSAGPKPLMLSSSARPPRDQSAQRAADVSSDLEMSRKVSSGPMAAHAAGQQHHSPLSSPRDSISSSGARPQRPSFVSRSSRNGHDSSHAGSESGGDYQTISSPPSESGSGPSRRSSLTPAGTGNGYGTTSGRGSVSSMTTSSKTSGRASGSIDYLVDGASTVSASKFGRASSRTSSGHNARREGSVGSLESSYIASPPATSSGPPSAWKKPLTSSSDVPLVRTVDVSLRSRPRRRRQDTGSSLESMSATPTDPRAAPSFGAAGPGGENAAETPGGDANGDNLVRYQLSDEPVVLDRSSDTITGSNSTSLVSTPSTSARPKVRSSRVGSTRSLSGTMQSKRNSVRSLEASDGVIYVPASEVLGTGSDAAPTDVVNVGPPLMEHVEELHEEAAREDEVVQRPTLMSPLDPVPTLRRQSPTGSLLSIDTHKARNLGVTNGRNGSMQGYGAMTPSPLPSPGPEAGMFVSADSLLAELGAQLEGISPPESSDYPSSGRRLRKAKDSSESDWAMETYAAAGPEAGEEEYDGIEKTKTTHQRRRTLRLSEEVVEQGTLDAIGSAFAQMDEP
ncbi:hypothetical protein OC835_001126 [Tilletia horrida]|nr:hypothetical protein OC835_001126 [Tilletia horrida]